MITRSALALAILAIAAPAHAGICEMIAQRAYQAAERRDRGLDQAPLRAEIADARRLNRPAFQRVFEAMLRDIPNDYSMSPREAYVISLQGPCGWPGASPRGGAADQVMRR